MRLLVVNVNTTESMTEGIADQARRTARPGTEIVGLTPTFGAESVEGNLESYLAAVAVMDRVLAYAEPFDAMIQAGYGEHGREGLQELLDVPVVDITEAAASTAMYLGRSYSVVTTLDRAVPLIEDRLLLAGLDRRCASVRASGMGVLELESDPERAIEAIVEQAMAAVREDHAEVICLGCGGMAELESAVRERTGVPVVDGVAAAVTVAESLVHLGLSTSKVRTYAPRPRQEDDRLAAERWPMTGPVDGRQLASVNDPEKIRGELARLREERGEVTSGSRTDARSGSGFDLVVRGARVLTTAGVVAREVGITDGTVTALEPLGAGLPSDRTITLADDETLIPGLVDAHVHVNEPGRTDWEGFASATRAAAAGGVTTILDMPLNSIPSTVNGPALELKQWVAAPQAFVDVGFWGGAVPGNKQYLRELHDAGVFGFKCFLLHSGVDEFPPLDPDELEEYLDVLRTYDALMIVHAEDSRAIDRAPRPEGDVYERFLASRPRGAENLAIAEVIERTRWTGARTHILHLSSSDALPMLRTAKADGLDLTVETCPHYLTLVSEAVPDGGTAYKCCPPIRETSNREQLWQGLLDGTIDYIASDHSPSTLDLKDLENGDFGVAWGGIASVQLGLSVVWTEARRRGLSLEQVVEWMATRPADRLRLRSKGRIALGYDADLAVFAPDAAFVVDAGTLHHKNPLTPYHEKALSGVVRRTFVRGAEVDYVTPHGRLIRRGID